MEETRSGHYGYWIACDPDEEDKDHRHCIMLGDPIYPLDSEIHINKLSEEMAKEALANYKVSGSSVFP